MYFPKSQIKTNLYTSGLGNNPLFLDNTFKVLYKGYYYKLSNGKKYTGKEPGDGENFLLFELTQNPFSQDNDEIGNTLETLNPKKNLVEIPTETVPIDEYGNIIDFETTITEEYLSITSQNIPPRTLLPSSFITHPTAQDYEEGKMIRYFTKKTNELIYKEISKDTYNQLKSKDDSILWSMYEPQKIEWIISNTPITFALRDNKTTVIKIEQKQKWYGFSKFLKEDYTKYWKS
jgi:hypothetical protein